MNDAADDSSDMECEEFLNSTTSSSTSMSSDDNTYADREKQPGVNDFIQTISDFSDSTFRSRRETVEILIQVYEEAMTDVAHHAGLHNIGTNKEIHMHLWYILQTPSHFVSWLCCLIFANQQPEK